MRRSAKRILLSYLTLQLIATSGVADGSTDPMRDSQLDSTIGLTLFINQTAQKAKPTIWSGRATNLAADILEASHRYELAPLLLLAVIKHESRFNPSVIGGHGEIGLMQIKPSTAMWLLQEGAVQPMAGLPAQPTTEMLQVLLRDPKMNVMFGAAYLAHLRESFKDRKSLYLTAYNMGAVSLKSRLRDGQRPHIYADNINRELLSLNLGLQKLSKMFQKSHHLTRHLASQDRFKTFVLN